PGEIYPVWKEFEHHRQQKTTDGGKQCCIGGRPLPKESEDKHGEDAGRYKPGIFLDVLETAFFDTQVGCDDDGQNHGNDNGDFTDIDQLPLAGFLIEYFFIDI